MQDGDLREKRLRLFMWQIAAQLQLSHAIDGRRLERRSRKLICWVTPAEHGRIQRQADLHDVSVSDFVRVILSRFSDLEGARKESFLDVHTDVPIRHEEG
jgi:hypothetical protein